MFLDVWKSHSLCSRCSFLETVKSSAGSSLSLRFSLELLRGAVVVKWFVWVQSRAFLGGVCRLFHSLSLSLSSAAPSYRLILWFKWSVLTQRAVLQGLVHDAMKPPWKTDAILLYGPVDFLFSITWPLDHLNSPINAGFWCSSALKQAPMQLKYATRGPSTLYKHWTVLRH